jgi:hypothetical protein
VIIAMSLTFNDNALDGNPAQYREPAGVIREGDGTVALRTDVDVTPYDAPPAEFVVRRVTIDEK